MNKFKFILIAITLAIGVLFGNAIRAQKSSRDTSILIIGAHATYQYQFPGADLAQRYGNNSNIGAGIRMKTTNNWLFGAQGVYLFGDNIKNEDEILANISTSEGEIITQAGTFANVIMNQQGFYFSGHIGKLFPVSPENLNSGICFIAGGGYLQHRINIETRGESVHQISGDYEKGYDKLTGGPAISQFIGYMHFGKNNLLNFYAGLEFTQAWTHGMREYDFNMRRKYDDERYETLWGIKIGWIIPFYKREKQKYYYY
ncbi:MAG: hypothetical protein K9I94_15245 [Bacteroidales bacterium]|nr:hypothetical protein [Bacteroidales bacterium]